ncbi:MAG: YciI family protein [Gemmatimonadaceae bacterium]
MRYMIMHKNDANTEAGNPPPMELVEKMGAFIGGYAQSGKLVDGAGLGGSKTRTRLVFRNGQATVKRGPYSGEHELPHAMLLLKVDALEEGLNWAKRYGAILGDGEIELGKVNEPWDIGLMPAPENPPLQFLLLDKANKTTESGTRSSHVMAALLQLKTEMKDAGVLQRDYTLMPSGQAKRLTFTNNRMKVLDGPFAESKELIGGFAVMELANIDEAVALCQPYAEILGGNLEIDVRQVDQ